MNKFRTLFAGLFWCIASIMPIFVSAQERRPIDSQHPLWMIHVDVWNQADPQKIINLIPDDIKPYVCMNLSLSCSYDKEKDVYMRPQNYLRTYKSWASVCQANGMWFSCQPASGGHTHIMDDDLETFEYFFLHYPNFLGWNYAEQFWGFDESGDKSSSSISDRLALFAKLIPMHHKYGGFLTISFCGNIWSHLLNPTGMMKQNADLLAACKQYPDAILWLYKYTTSSCFYNNESVAFGPFVAGLANNYGVRYDNCGWNGALDAILGDNHNSKYPVAAGIGTVMEQTGQNGGAVWDGPELIWTEDFQNLNNSTVNGYTQRNWGTFPGFNNAWIDMFRKIIDGTLYIPTRKEVVEKTKIIVVNNVTSGSDEDKYATWADLYDGLYKQTDPFNKNNGQWMDNYLYLKSTGRYGTIPMAPCLNDELSKSIPTQIKKSQRTSVWPSVTTKKSRFDAAYPVVSTGDLFVSRFKNQLITYTPYSYLNVKKTATANIPLSYNTCSSLDLTWGKLSSAIVREYSDSIIFYMNNYRTDSTSLIMDEIVVNGATAQPSYSLKKRVSATASVSGVWDAETQKYTLKVKHNGPVDVIVYCAGNESERSSDLAGYTTLPLPKQPEAFDGALIFEAEDMNYRSIKSCEVIPYYSSYSWVRGHSGNGFIDLGTNTNGSLTYKFNVSKAGKYLVVLRYSNTAKNGSLGIKLNSIQQSMRFQTTSSNEWRKDTLTFSLIAGTNTFTLNNTSGVAALVDQLIVVRADIPAEQFAITLRDAEHGTVDTNCEAAEEGKLVRLTAVPDNGYEFIGWNLIHGQPDFIEEGDSCYSFLMPDEHITLQPIFADATLVYKLDYANVLNGAIPEGWSVEQESSTIHDYPNTYGSGSRTFSGFSGTYSKALYWRCVSACYGKQAAYPLTLEPGEYTLHYAMAAWKGTPRSKAQILKSAGSVVAQNSYSTATPNANGATSANLSGAVVQELKFTITSSGNYLINFLNEGTGFSEFLLADCYINKVPTINGLEPYINVDEMNGSFEIFDMQGSNIPSLRNGMNIIRFSNGTVKKVYVK